jgi:hypothetical protein
MIALRIADQLDFPHADINPCKDPVNMAMEHPDCRQTLAPPT